MTNFFAGIHRANDALTAARYGLDVTGQNIANANTPGYTRQRADQVAVSTPVGVPTLHSGTGVNGGVRATGASRLGDMVLDDRARAEHARSASMDTTAARYADLENIFREPSDTGLAEQLHDFWNAWGDVSNDPGGQVPREMLIASATATVTKLHAMNSSLNDVATAARDSLDALVTRVNTAAADLSELNRKISIGHATGANVNALLDQRDLLLDDLAQSVGAVATIHDNGTATVTIDGEMLVSVGPAQNGAPGFGGPPFTAGTLTAGINGHGNTTLALTPAGGGGDVLLVDPDHVDDSDPSDPAPDPISRLESSAAAAEIGALNDLVPRYRVALDKVAQDLADTVNQVQDDGYDLTGATGAPMFGSAPTGTAITAGSITVAMSDWRTIAAGTDPAPGGTLDASNALAASKLGASDAGPDAAYSSLIGDLGRRAASAQQQQQTQGVITASVDGLKATASGVSFDEEVSNMLTYQMAFQASSRVLTTWDEMLDTLINRTGMVGR